MFSRVRGGRGSIFDFAKEKRKEGGKRRKKKESRTRFAAAAKILARVRVVIQRH